MKASLLDHTVADIVTQGRIVLARGCVAKGLSVFFPLMLLFCRDELVPAVLARMAAEEIIAVPVQEGEHVGSFFDLADFLALLFSSPAVDVTTVPVSQARNRSGHDVFLSVEPGTGLYTLAEYFSRGVHRVPVVVNGRVVAIVSQSALLQHLASHLDKQAGELDYTLHQAGLARHAAVVVPATSSLREALKTLHEGSQEAAAVVEGDRKLVGVVDLPSLRGLDVPRLQQALEQPVAQFVASRSNKSIVSSPKATVRETIGAVVAKRAHHVFLVEEGGRVVGEVTLSDLVRHAIKSADRHAKKH